MTDNEKILGEYIPELDNCPFCGGDAEMSHLIGPEPFNGIHYSGKSYELRAECITGCGAEIMEYRTFKDHERTWTISHEAFETKMKHDLATVWNTRI